LIFNENQEVDKEFISFVLKSFNLTEDVKHYPGHLKCTVKDGSRISFSLKRKISIVRTILSNRDILIFDIQMEEIDSEFISQLKFVLGRIKKTVIISGNHSAFADFADIVYSLEKN
jgi:ABC-type multidrug transport system fused ATPase/permease subunit